jgi:PKD repeat protein
MKKLIYLTLILPLALFSCESIPEAFFHTDNAEPEVGEEVFFINDSNNGSTFEWDFGDGYISNEENPGHIYTGTGTYEVLLTVKSKKGLTDEAVMTIKVMIPTLLEIEVLEYYDEYPVADASVILYSSITDWDSEKNSVSEGFTDDDGIVVFSNLEPFVYYADIWEATHDNYALRDLNVNYIRTPEILPHKINRFYAYVDKVVRSKGDGRRGNSYVIKKLERRITDKTEPLAYPGTDDWQSVYNKRVVKK